MIRGQRTIALAIVAIGGLTIGGLGHQASAAVITNGCSAGTTCTLQELIGGATIQIGDKLYDQWLIFDGFESFPHVTPRFSGAAVAADLTQIIIEPIEADPLRHILSFDLGSQLLSPIGNNEAFLPFGYVVQTMDGSARIHDNVLELTVFELFGDGAGVQVAECADPDEFSIEDCPGFKVVGANDRGIAHDLLQSVIYDPPLSKLFVFTSVAAQSFALTGGAQLSGFIQEWSQLPVSVAEPTGLAAIGLGLGLLALGSARRRASRVEPR